MFFNDRSEYELSPVTGSSCVNCLGSTLPNLQSWRQGPTRSYQGFRRTCRTGEKLKSFKRVESSRLPTSLNLTRLFLAKFPSTLEKLNEPGTTIPHSKVKRSTKNSAVVTVPY